MNLQTIYNNKHLFGTRNIGSELILVPIKNNVANMTELYTLNEVGSFIWGHIDGVKTIDDIVKALTEEFCIDEITAKKDIEEFLEKISLLITNN